MQGSEGEYDDDARLDVVVLPEDYIAEHDSEDEDDGPVVENQDAEKRNLGPRRLYCSRHFLKRWQCFADTVQNCGLGAHNEWKVCEGRGSGPVHVPCQALCGGLSCAAVGH